MLPLIIYVHGFNSSPSSIKAQLLGQYLETHHAPFEYLVPELSHWPAEAMQSLDAIIAADPERPVTLVGSSLGGYYSTWLAEKYSHVRVVLVNPAVMPYRLLADWLGENENLYTHEQYELTPLHLQQLIELDCAEVTDLSRYLLLTQTADETLDYREAVDKFAGATQFVQPGGSHGFDCFENLIPSILAFADGRIELPPVTPL